MFKHYINGQLVDGEGSEVKIYNPATEEYVGSFHKVSQVQTQFALESAQKGFEYWSKLSIKQRSEKILELKNALLEKKETILDLLMAETGKVLATAEYDFGMLIQCLEYYPEEVKRKNGEIIEDYDNNFRNFIIHQPVGVVVAYVAWNFPMLNLGYKLGPSLATGCAAIIKPSNQTPLASMLVGEIAAEIGFPAGVFNILAGSHHDMCPTLNSSSITKMITMIGSTNAGKSVIEDSATTIKKLSLELGGNAPAIVFPDADIDRAAYYLADLKSGNSGQVCVNVNRTYVHESVHEEFLKDLKAYVEKIKMGWGRQEGASMGPMISKKEQLRMAELVKDAVDKGAKIICGGHVPEDEKGYFFPPTILDNVTRDMRLYSEEIFGPILPVMAYTDNDDVVELANDTEYGLASYLFTKDYQRVFEVAEKIHFGTVCVNEPLFAINLPHGGMWESGVGKDCSKYSLDEYYNIKRISLKMK